MTKKKARMGPNQVQVNFLCNREDLDELDRNIRPNTRSKVINSLIRAFNQSKRTTTDLHINRKEV